MRSYNPVSKGHSGQIKKAFELLVNAKRPILYTGGGVIIGRAHQELIELARALNYPVTNTLMGLGWISGNRSAVRRYAGHARQL